MKEHHPIIMSSITPGFVWVFLEPQRGAPDFHTWRLNAFKDLPKSTLTDVLTATDTEDKSRPYRHVNIYKVEDLRCVDEKLVQHETVAAKEYIARSEWLLYGGISFDERDGLGARLPGTVVVSVGMAPTDKPEVVADYHQWYIDEHMPLLALVPGWRTGSRYSLAKHLGDQAEYAAPFLAVHQYDEDNGLGGPEWKASVYTQWTERVMSNLSAPNHRRTWKCVI